MLRKNAFALNLKFLFPLLALVILILMSSIRFFGFFPAGKILNPFVGALQNENEKLLHNKWLVIDNGNLSRTVNIYFDNRKVPHIYAKNTNDLFYAQGYITAYLRLWQMDILSRQAAGQMSEIFDDEKYLNFDRNQRRIGIPQAAADCLKFICKNDETMAVLNAYTKGVNAYISKLKYKDFPIEYKYLDIKPELWSNLKTLLILKQFGNTFSGQNEDFFMSAMMLAIGEKDFNLLYPDFPPRTTLMSEYRSIEGKKESRDNLKKPEYLNFSFFSGNPLSGGISNEPQTGGNSWVVSGERTRSGKPILACDPNLSLTFPNIWLESQLSSPGLNVYGVTIPGVPANMIGFNEKIAWGLTNGEDDVKDWYKLDMTPDLKFYELNGKWIPLKKRNEYIQRRNKATFIDTVYYTVFGPVVYGKQFKGTQPGLENFALKWSLHAPSNELLTFIKLNRSANFSQFKNAISSFGSPILNFIFACSNDTIAAIHQGVLEKKSNGNGRFLLDGRTFSQRNGFINADSLPQVINPESNYIVSAGQHPANSNSAFYYNGNFSEERAKWLSSRLSNNKNLDIKAMMALQLDSTNSFAAVAMPIITQLADKHRLTRPEQLLYENMRAWKCTNKEGDPEAKLFDLWWDNITTYTWDEFLSFPFYEKPPKSDILLSLLKNDPTNHYFDLKGTTKIENASDIVTEAFIRAAQAYQVKDVRWGNLTDVTFAHLKGINAFGMDHFRSPGTPQAINAIQASWGPSWRMIVELGKRPKAFGILPGGELGNIGSPDYEKTISDWKNGKYFRLDFYLSEAEADKGASAIWNLR